MVDGWAGRVMVFLRVGTQLVAVNVLVVLGTLLGAVVLGTYPALAAGGGLLARLVSGSPSEHLWREFWSAYRAGFRRLNVLGAPLTAGFVLLDAREQQVDGRRRDLLTPVRRPRAS